MSEPSVINFYSVNDEFGEFSNFAAVPLDFEHVKTEVLLDAIVQTHYRRRRR